MSRIPAFDVTPHEYVTAIITERGIARSPYHEIRSVEMCVVACMNEKQGNDYVGKGHTGK